MLYAVQALQVPKSRKLVNGFAQGRLAIARPTTALDIHIKPTLAISEM